MSDRSTVSMLGPIDPVRKISFAHIVSSLFSDTFGNPKPYSGPAGDEVRYAPLDQDLVVQKLHSLVLADEASRSAPLPAGPKTIAFIDLMAELVDRIGDGRLAIDDVLAKLHQIHEQAYLARLGQPSQAPAQQLSLPSQPGDNGQQAAALGSARMN